MAADDTAALWRRSDETVARVQGVEIKQAQTEGQIALLSSTCQNIQAAMLEHRNEARETARSTQKGIATLTEKVEALNLHKVKQESAGLTRRELLATAVALCSILGLVAKLLGWY